MKKILILFGGASYEHQISCISAKTILENIDKSKYHDPTDYDLIRANQSLLDYTYNQIIENHLYFGDIFTFQFISFKPLKTLESYNSVPTSIYFKFTFPSPK